MNLLELAIKIFVDNDEANKGLDDTEKKASGMASKIGKGLSLAAKAGAAAVGAAATGIAAVTKQAVSAYGEYEQLSGGISTLYKTNANQMMAYAKNAYKTAGLSANEYMETAIQSSAAMISALEGDTYKAAKMTNMAITDMSDNVNKMGTTMEAVQNAYRGFSRGNFTMLDNLALGFAGTKEGMQELLDKAKELSGVEYNIDSYADIVQAIHVVQTEMGITGTTAKEGAETIQGSLATLKAAWQNLVTGFANPDANLGQLIDDLVASAETAFKNLMPAIEHALGGVAQLIEHIAPMIAEKLPALVEQILPPLLNAATTLVIALVNALPQLIPIIVEALPGIISQIWDAIVQIVQTQSPAIAAIMGTLGEVLGSVFNWLIENGDTIIGIVTDIFTVFMLWEGLGFVVGIIQSLTTILPVLWGILSANPLGVIIVAITAIILVIKNLWETNEEFRNGVINTWNSIKDFFTGIVNWIDTLLTGIVALAKTWGSDLIGNFIGGIKEKWDSFKGTISDIAGTVKDYLGFSEPKKGPLSNFHTYAPDMMELFAKGVKDNEDLITYQLDKSFDFGNSIVPEKNTITNKDNNTKDNNVASNQNIVVNVELEGIASEILRVVKQEAKKIYNSSGYNTIVYGG